MKILVIEDDIGIARAVKRVLEKQGYTVDTVQDGERGLCVALEGDYGLIILDIMLPGRDGYSVCKELRNKKSLVPVLMLTARGTTSDKVMGLDIGADDYLPKPFEFDELLARVQALIRRDKMNRSRWIHVADLEIDTALHRVTMAGQELHLSQREFLLLEALAANEGRVLTREVIQERIWMDDDSFSNIVDVYIGLLRKKLETDGRARLIHTVRGLGYTLRQGD